MRRLLNLLCIVVVLNFCVLPLLTLFVAIFTENSVLVKGLPSIFQVWENSISIMDLEKRIIGVSGDDRFFHSLLKSVFLSMSVSLIVTLITFLSGFYITRTLNGFGKTLIPLSLSTYLFPPVILALTSTAFWNDWWQGYNFFKIALSHSVFLIPIGLVLSTSFWSQKSYAIDRNAACDGANIWRRLLSHMGSDETFHLGVVSILIFMVSWTDIVFSRVIAATDKKSRTIVDYLFERLFSNPDMEQIGHIALLGFILLIVSWLFSYAFAVVFYKGVIERY